MGLPKQHGRVVGRGGAQAGAPLLHPTDGATDGIRQGAGPPVRVIPHQDAEGDAIGQHRSIHCWPPFGWRTKNRWPNGYRISRAPSYEDGSYRCAATMSGHFGVPKRGNSTVSPVYDVLHLLPQCAGRVIRVNANHAFRPTGPSYRSRLGAAGGWHDSVPVEPIHVRGSGCDSVESPHAPVLRYG